MIDDVALIDAELLWNDGLDQPAPVVVARPTPPTSPSMNRLLVSFDNAVGSCFSGWREKTDAARLAEMLSWAWQAVVRNEVDAVVMHEAMMVIPEIRAAMTPDMLPEQYRQERPEED